MSYRRAVIAAGFAVLYPGLGHVYLREWVRAVAWIGTAVVVAALVLPDTMVEAFDAGGVGALVEASADLPLETVVALSAVRLLNVVDAVRVALNPRPEPAAGPTCPHCRRGIDPELDFCPWCTTTFDDGVPGRSS